jgi:N-acetylmuramoyl-L-alanine amidase
MFLITLATLCPAQDMRAEMDKVLRGVVAPDGDPLITTKTKVLKAETLTTAVVLELSKEAVERPWRPAYVDLLLATLRKAKVAPENLPVVVIVENRHLEEYIPPYFRAEKAPRNGPSPLAKKCAAPLREKVQPQGFPPITGGLAGKHIVLWPSHGLYYDSASERWIWQRPRMFTTVEDKLTMSVVNDYLIPMLERAGATVISCRERDYQIHEVIVDDADGEKAPQGKFQTESFRPSSRPGFASGKAPYAEGVNPHTLGTTHEWVQGSTSGVARWIPNIPESGEYAVYVSYSAAPENSHRAHYRIRYQGGVADFHVNQQIGGNMWVYLGTFYFAQGLSADHGCVELLTDSSSPGNLSADAVKFGGGMGDVLRAGKPSGYPRYLEAARYWMQFCGADPQLVYAFGKHAGNDYTEDYIGRPEYVNYLLGAPCGPNENRNAPGKGIPVDVAFALHTDAGVSTGTVGTLAIYKLVDEKKSDHFPDGRDRMLCRDLADLVQTQIVEDIRKKFCSTWARRQLADRDYAESRRPNVPTVLIEALSHQNYDDIKFALDPRFRHDWARAIYKGILRFLATESGYEPIVAPLAPRILGVRYANGSVRIDWEPQQDELEPSATPTGFIVYRRIGEGGFDQGTYIAGGDKRYVDIPIQATNPTAVESFCVSAVNAGGESAPSDIYCVSAGHAQRVLIVHGFDRLAPPALVAAASQTPDNLGGHGWEGVVRSRDRGVADGINSPLVGDQFDFDRSHSWVGDDSPYTNDHPGHGASYGDLETTQELGRSRDLAFVHAKTFAALGYGVDTVSASAAVRLPAGETANHYSLIDFLLGEQRSTLPPPAHVAGAGDADRYGLRYEVWPQAMRAWVKQLCEFPVTLLVSGAYVATDPVVGPAATAETRAFVKDTLRCRWTCEVGSQSNDVVLRDAPGRFHVSKGVGEEGIYGVESPGGIAPAHKTGKIPLSYADSGVGSAVRDASGKASVIVLAFPFECVVGDSARVGLLKQLLTTK